MNTWQSFPINLADADAKEVVKLYRYETQSEICTAEAVDRPP